VTHTMTDQDQFVPITGIVHRSSTLGVFLDILALRVFIPADCTATASRVFEPGEAVTVNVFRWFAKEEGLIGHDDSERPSGGSSSGG